MAMDIFSSSLYDIKKQIVTLIKKYLNKIFHQTRITSESKAPWAKSDIIFAYRKRLLKETTLGPVYYNGEITESIPDGLLLSHELQCIIEIRNNDKSIDAGVGCFYGNGHVLTVHHLLKKVKPGCEIFVIFPISYDKTSDDFLVYKADYNAEFCNTYTNRDQAFLKLYGNTSPLGDGLQNHINIVSENDNVYVYLSTDLSRFQKQEWKVIHPYSSMKDKMLSTEFVMSKSGRKGDSGSPIFCNGKLVGIYFGEFYNEDLRFGRGSKILPDIFPWPSSGCD